MHSTHIFCTWWYYALWSPLQGFHVDTLTMDRVSPLHEACLGGHYACAKFLLENGANVRALSIFSWQTGLFLWCLCFILSLEFLFLIKMDRFEYQTWGIDIHRFTLKRKQIKNAKKAGRIFMNAMIPPPFYLTGWTQTCKTILMATEIRLG